MAAAFGVPSVVIFGADDPEIWGPWRTAGEVVPRPAASRESRWRRCWTRWSGCGCRHEGAAAAASYGRKYWPQIAGSVVLMALAGAAQGTMPLLIRPIFDRVLVPNAPDGPDPAAAASDARPPGSIWTASCRSAASVWTMVALAMLLAFLIKGLCDYLGNYLVSYAGFASVTRPAQRGLRQSAEAGRAVLRGAFHRAS